MPGFLDGELCVLCLQDPKSGEVVEKDLYVTRKGATPAADGQMGLIPGSMGQPAAAILHAWQNDACRSRSLTLKHDSAMTITDALGHSLNALPCSFVSRSQVLYCDMDDSGEACRHRELCYEGQRERTVVELILTWRRPLDVPQKGEGKHHPGQLMLLTRQAWHAHCLSLGSAYSWHALKGRVWAMMLMEVLFF